MPSHPDRVRRAYEDIPKANPVCTHEWRQDAARMVYVCATCGYTISELERVIPHEGDGR